MTPFVETRKLWVRYREGVPETEMQYLAHEGCRQLGLETEAFTWVDDVDEKMHDLGPDVGISGYIGDVWHALKRVGKDPPEPVDYPDELVAYLGRAVERTTVRAVRNTIKPIFVKPVEHKVFTGFVHKCDGASRMRLVSCADDVPCWTSEVIDFVSEHRVFVLRGEILDVRRYKGDWAVAPSRAIVEQAVAAWKSKPEACCLDFGVTRSSETLLVEANDGFSFGAYGLAATAYVRMISARWNQLVTGRAP